MVFPAKKPWRKWLIIAAVLVLITGVAVYWFVSTEKFSDTKGRKPAYTVNALDFIREFSVNDSLANNKYADKIVVVNGRISEIEAVDSTYNIKFIDTTSGSYAIFAFQEQHVHEARSVKAGDSVSIKGSFSDSIYSDILGITAITFKRSTLNK